ncbi:MAG: hypothetical protein AAF922_17495 [Pseudomonadota bacterium]
MRHVINLVCALFFVVSAHPLHASDPFEEVTQLDLWNVIEADDVRGAEDMFAQAFAGGLNDPPSRDHVRWLYEVFGTSAPEASTFALRWVETFPDSPFSHTALAWIYYQTGFDIRGERFLRETYPDAYILFHELHHKAWTHAERAYELEPNLRPASDAILRLAKSTGNQMRAADVLDKVMTQDPNMGTLFRGLDMTTQNWGSLQFLADPMCQRYGPMIQSEDGTDFAKLCMLYAAGFHQRSEKRDWFLAEAEKREFPEIDYLYARAISPKHATRAQAEFLNEYLSRPDIAHHEVAYEFDATVAQKYGYPFQYETHIRRAKAWAAKTIEFKPYDQELLKTLVKDISGFSAREDGGYRVSVLERTPIEEKREYTRRLLQISPYEPQYWREYAQYAFDRTDPEQIFRDEPFLINALVYSDHDTVALASFATSRWRLLSQLERIEWEMQTPAWKAQSPEQLEKSTRIAEAWIKRRETLDLDKQIRCPMMRAYRLYMEHCHGLGGQCGLSSRMQEMLEIVKSDVNQRRVCKGVMSSPVSQLYFESVAVELQH